MKSYSTVQKLERKGLQRRRRPTWRLRFARLGLLSVLLAAACADDQAPDTVLHVIEVSPQQAVVMVGDTLELTARPRRPDGNVVADMPLTWSTRHPERVEVGGSQHTTRVVGLRAGLAEVNASAHGKIGVATIEVQNRLPVLTEILPAATVAGTHGITVTVKGSSFAPGAQVTWNGATRPTEYIGVNEVRASIPASDLTTSGTAQIAVVNPAPGGGASASAAFTVSPSAVARIELTPDVAVLMVGQSVTVAASAQNGAGDVVPAQITWSTSHPEVATITQPHGQSTPGVSLVVLTGATPGMTTISVSAGGVSRHFTVTVAAAAGMPRITSITPDSVESNPDGLEITIRGENFARTSGAFLNGSSRPTTFVSATELKMTLWDGDLRTSATRQIHVFNPGTGGGMSAGVAFRIVPGVWRVEVTPAIIALWPGEELQLTATAYDEANRPLTGRAVKWQSSNPTVMAVDSTGRVRALAHGVATIDAIISARTGYRGAEVHQPLPWDLLYEGTHGGFAELWLLTLGPNTAPRRLLPAGTFATEPAVSPDGRQVAYVGLSVDGARNIFVVNRDGTGIRQLTHHPTTDDQPAWSRDGTRIAFRSVRDGVSDIFVMNADGSGAMNVTRNTTRATDGTLSSEWPSWTPAGRIVFSHGYANLNPRPYRLMSVLPDGSDFKALTDGATRDYEADVAPSGELIALRRGSQFGDHLDVIAGDGTGLAWINHPGAGSAPSWSPDSRWLTFAASTGNGQSSISVTSLNSMGGGIGGRLSAVVAGRNPTWLPRN
jgi:hypothetical protein